VTKAFFLGGQILCRIRFRDVRWTGEYAGRLFQLILSLSIFPYIMLSYFNINNSDLAKNPFFLYFYNKVGL
jgi:hypothetical protein